MFFSLQLALLAGAPAWVASLLRGMRIGLNQAMTRFPAHVPPATPPLPAARAAARAPGPGGAGRPRPPGYPRRPRPPERRGHRHARHARAPALARPVAPAPLPPRPELLWELDPYYSSAALEIPLTGLPLPDGGQLSERAVYTRLLRGSLRPRLLLLEASIYPLPILGNWYKRKAPRQYDDFQIGTLGNNRLNVLDGVTAGFQEPWALSAFIGSGMQFTRENQVSNAAQPRPYGLPRVLWRPAHPQQRAHRR